MSEYGVVEAPDERRKEATAKTLVFTSAQSNTRLHEGFFNALRSYCEDRGAELHIGRFTYNKQFWTKETEDEDVWWDERLVPYFSDESIQITDDLVWCGELNIIPTRVHPLSTLTNYTREASGIVPHAKMQMQSVPTMKHLPTKFMYTTGACTLRNYIQKVAGQVADFHHVFGAIVVEVEGDTWWARQINADKSGGFYDLNTYYEHTGKIIRDQRVYAITHGDIHVPQFDHEVVKSVFGKHGILDKLRPYEQFLHDLIDFSARNHHNIKDPVFLYDKHISGQGNVEAEFFAARAFLNTVNRRWCKTSIVTSNHDMAIEHWLRNPVAMYDPENVRFWHLLNYKMYDDRSKNAFEHALNHTGKITEKIIREDESYRILGEIECGLHGHLGPNGARGNPKNLRTAGKANTGHTHSAGIIEGVYTAGVYSRLDLGYNKGLSSWSHSFVVTYANAKRSILTIKNGRAWR